MNSQEGPSSGKAIVVWGCALLAAGLALRPLLVASGIASRGIHRLCARPPRWRRRVLLAAFAIGGTATLNAVLFANSPRRRLEDFLDAVPPTIGRIEDGRGALLAELFRERRHPFADQELPPVLVDALLAAEDRSFFEHHGVDPRALPRVTLKAVSASLRARRVVLPQGGSTLTQQLVRAVLLRDWRAREAGSELLCDCLPDRVLALGLRPSLANKLRRKMEEIRLAYWLEAELESRLGSRTKAKHEILRRYATYVYLGQGLYGFAAASELYLGRPLSSLRRVDAPGAALLAGLPRSPSDYAPVPANRTRARRRRDHVLALMARRGYITPRELERYRSEPLRVVAARAPESRSEVASVVSIVFDELDRSPDSRISTSALYDGRLAVRATVILEAQRVLNDALESGLRRYEARHPAAAAGVVQGSAVVLANHDARVLALAGGRLGGGRPAGYRDFNRATESLRQPGSAFKPLVYLAAFRRGATLESQVLDEPVAVPMSHDGALKWIGNYDGTFRGPITLRQALAESRNAATVRLVAAMGVPPVLQAARELGIKSELRPYVTTALGASEVTLLELAGLYRSLASGLYSEPWLLERVTAASGLELYRHVPREPRRLHHPSVGLIQEALRGAVRLPRGTGHALASLEVPVMGKTGTTNDFRDALFVGATYGPSGVTVAVRIGFDDNRPLGAGETGARVALPIFKETIVGLYARGLLGSPPTFPAAIEEGIDAYLAAAALETPAPPLDAGPAVSAPAAVSSAPASPTATPGSKD